MSNWKHCPDDDGCSVRTSCAVSRCPGLVAPGRGGDVAWSVLIVVAASTSRPLGSPSCNHSPLIPLLATTTATGRAAVLQNPSQPGPSSHVSNYITDKRVSAVCRLGAAWLVVKT